MSRAGNRVLRYRADLIHLEAARAAARDGAVRR